MKPPKLLITVAKGNADCKPVSMDMFGTNLLFDRDRDSVDPEGGRVSNVFESAIDKLRVTTLRYPGGTISEKLFDLANPNSANQVISWALKNVDAFDPDGGGPLKPGTLTLTGAIDFANLKNVSLTIVLPTYSFLGQSTDDQGHRLEVVDDAAVQSFILSTLREAWSHGVIIQAFELGNEWWADNSSVFGTLMTPTEYGRIASHLARVVHAGIVDFEAEVGLSVSYPKPDVVVQVGPGGNAEQYLLNGFAAPKGFSGNTIAATDLIFREFERGDELAAISGVVTHRYLTGSSANIDGWKYRPFDRFSELAFSNAGISDLTRYVSEWNVAGRNEEELGHKHAGAIVSLFSEMAFAGVDHANIWSIQQNNQSRLAQNAGFAGESFGGLTSGGVTFRLMRDALPELQPEKISDNNSNLLTYLYGADDRKVLYIINSSDHDESFSFVPGSILDNYKYGWAAIVEPNSGMDPASSSLAEVHIISGSDLILNGKIAYTLHPSDVMQLSLVASRGVSIDGTEGFDRIIGSSYNDNLFGGDGNDVIVGCAGRDSIDGGTGSDVLIGGSIDWTFDYISGQVFRLYKTILGREPDRDGHFGNTILIAANSKSLEQTASDLSTSPEFYNRYGSLDNRDFVTQLYRNVLGRTPAEWEVGGWLRSLNNGVDRIHVSLGFSESQEFCAKTSATALSFSQEGYRMHWSDDVFRLYQTILDRTPDRAGFLGWTGALAGGMPWEAIIDGFMKSSEFGSRFPNLDNKEFVTQLYNTAFHRSPDPEGLKGWLEALNSGVLSRAQAVNGFIQSTEAKAASAPRLPEWMHGQGADDVLASGQGNDVLFGGVLSDTFVFRAHEQGVNRVIDFESWDVLRLDGFGYASSDEAISHMHQLGDDVQFSDQEVQITFTHAHIADFHDSISLI